MDSDGNSTSSFSPPPSPSPSSSSSSSTLSSLSSITAGKVSRDTEMSFTERSVSAAGAAVLSAIIVNPLDVAKTRLQAQAVGVPYPSRSQHEIGRHMLSQEPKSKYKGTVDVFYKVIKQEGLGRLWRGTNASLVLAIPTVGIYLPCYDIFNNWIENYTIHNVPKLTPYAPLFAGSAARSLACMACSPIELARTRMQAFKEVRSEVKLPGMWKTLIGVISPVRSANNLQTFQSFRILWTGVGAQLARDVPFSAICWSTLEPMRRNLLELVNNEGNAGCVLGANFTSGVVAGGLAAVATCPLDVAKTRRQIEKDPVRVLKMNTRKTLVEIWRERGITGLFAGVGPRVARAGPSVGIVVSFYEVVKYVLHQRHQLSSGAEEAASC